MAKSTSENSMSQKKGKGVVTANETRADGDISSVRKPRDVMGQNRDKILNSPMRNRQQ